MWQAALKTVSQFKNVANDEQKQDQYVAQQLVKWYGKS